MAKNDTLKGRCIGIQEILELTGYTRQRIDQLTDEGVTVKKGHGQYEAFETVQRLFGYVKNRKTNQHDGDPNTEEGKGYEFHRARLTQAKADIAELDAELKKGTVHAASDIAAVMSDMIANARAKFLSFPTKLAGALDGLDTVEREGVIREHVNELLTELRDYKPSMFNNATKADADEDEEDEDEDESADA